MTYSTGLGFDAKAKPFINGRGFGDTGMMNTKVFIDENSNGAFDEVHLPSKARQSPIAA